MTEKLRLVRTCHACPEQYDVYLQDECIGYMRLRHGYFYAEYRGDTVYDARPCGDGIFEWDERNKHLNGACRAILDAHHKVGEEELLYTIEDGEDS